MKLPLLCLATLIAGTSSSAAVDPLRVLIVDGQNNHDWRATTPHLKQVLEGSGRFTVEVATAPGAGGDMKSFKPDFTRYHAVLSNYNGASWSPETRTALVKYVRAGGAFVSVHAANNSFPDWPEYNELIGVGGWGGRSEQSGPWLYWQDKIVRDTSPGPGGSHGAQHAFKLITRAPEHPIMAGLPTEWRHAQDELYDRLRGPANNLTVLATAWSDPMTNGTGKHEPLLFALTYGLGRVFHTALGHNNGADLTAQKCVGFITTLLRGTEWAATGQVTIPVPADFPTATEARNRD